MKTKHITLIIAAAIILTVGLAVAVTVTSTTTAQTQLSCGACSVSQPASQQLSEPLCGTKCDPNKVCEPNNICTGSTKCDPNSPK